MNDDVGVFCICMTIQTWAQKFHIPLHVITWGCFLLIVGIFGSYAFLLQQKEMLTQDRLRSEIHILREEKQLLLEENQELEQACTPSNQSSSSDIPATDSLAPELKQANQRSFVHTVRKGDTIWDIAALYDVDVRALMRWNKLNARSRIFPGDQLTIILEE